MGMIYGCMLERVNQREHNSRREMGKKGCAEWQKLSGRVREVDRGGLGYGRGEEVKVSGSGESGKWERWESQCAQTFELSTPSGASLPPSSIGHPQHRPPHPNVPSQTWSHPAAVPITDVY